ncbi:protein-glutamate O-methyltransferase CheR [Paenibacillus sp. J2TS4]|uniref:CheR family methyltransferase n=1 Tax=Paenibacillus sp. J2TS4 TaxID=2807194 RepID=UPI001BCFACC3|nr:protein-glutamate O-methyltransferase CheR [Paenibacillus sp. J2TS4]
MEDRDFALFTENVKRLTAIDLNQYKEVQMKRRLSTFRMKKGFTTFQQLFEKMSSDKALLDEFLDRMTINVSEFFRNPNRWEALQQKFLPAMLQQGGRLKCWSAACSTGEEPYTLAMILHELQALDSATLLATDLDEGVLAKAQEGLYSERSIKEVPKPLLNKYFDKENGGYRIQREKFRKIDFRKQNLLEDRFDANFDLIICRNVMIYFTEEAKQLLYQKFSDALKPGGILFVGSTEQIFSPGKFGLEPADTFFYRKKL